jgi:hypothetical protein
MPTTWVSPGRNMPLWPPYYGKPPMHWTRKLLALLMIPPLSILVLTTAALILALRAVWGIGRTEP